jgi:hypothetical protein
MADDKKDEAELKPPVAKVRAVIVSPGQKLSFPDEPPVTEKTLKLSFRATEQNVLDIQEHLDRLVGLAPGIVFTITDALRSLVQRGAEGFREDDRRKHKEDK